MPDQGTPELILHEARAKRAKQDGQLQALLRLATGALIVSLYRRRRPSRLQLQIVLISRLQRDYDHNNKTLKRVRQLVALQALIAFLGIVILLFGFYELA